MSLAFTFSVMYFYKLVSATSLVAHLQICLLQSSGKFK